MTHRGAPAFRQILDVLYEVKKENQCCGDNDEHSVCLSVYDRSSDFCNIQQKRPSQKSCPIANFVKIGSIIFKLYEVDTFLPVRPMFTYSFRIDCVYKISTEEN